MSTIDNEGHHMSPHHSRLPRTRTKDSISDHLDHDLKSGKSSYLFNLSPVNFVQLISFGLLLVVLLLQSFFATTSIKTLLPPSRLQRSLSTPTTSPSALFDPHTCESPHLFPTREPISIPHKMSLLEKAKQVAAQFELTDEDVRRTTNHFVDQLKEGLKTNGTDMSQIPTFVTGVPDGTEKGLYLAVDLGGTNFRVCSIQLLGDTTFNLTQSKVAIPKELMVAKTAKELFSFLALQIEKFLKTHHEDHFEAHIKRRATVSTPEGYRDESIFKLGFTFSFPVHQTGIASGNLIRWTKGFDIQDAVGKDVCKLLQDEIDALHLPVKVAALVNDTVGTLMARAYTSPGETSSLLGAIFGTGTNGAYVEKVDNITKTIEGEFDKASGEMVINTEWGSFDNTLKVLKLTTYDKELDAGSVNPGIQMFEKLISGMFLGEILRVVIVDLHKGYGLLRHDNSSQNDLKSSTFVYEDSPLHTPWGVDSSILSIAAADESVGLRALRQEIKRLFGVSGASLEDAEAIKVVAAAIAKRAARLAGSAVAGVVLQSGRLKVNDPAPASKIVDDVKAGNLQSAVETAASKVVNTATVPESEIVDIGVDGSLVEFYPNFEELMREGLRAVDGIGAAGERRIRIGIAKDGSGVGAALIALVADKMDKKDNLGQLRSKLGNVNLAQDGSAQQ